MCTCLLTLTARPTANALTPHSIDPVYIFQSRRRRPKFSLWPFKSCIDCAWELQSEEFKNICRSEVGLFMSCPCGGPRGSQVNIKGDWWWASWLRPQCWSSSRQRLHHLNICTTFRAGLGKEKWFAVLPVSSKREKKIFQNQSEINVCV